MKKDEGLGTRIWLEDWEQASGGASIQPSFYKFNLKITELSKLKAYAKENKYKLDEVSFAAWGILLNKLCTAEIVVTGISTASLTTKSASSTGIIKPIISEAESSKTIKQFISSIKKQKIDITSKKTDEVKEINYLYLTKSKTKSKQSIAVARYALSLFHDAKQAGKFTFIYNPQLFNIKTIETIANYYQTILLSLCLEPKRKVTDIQMMPDKVLKKVTRDWATPLYPNTVTLSKPVYELVDDFARFNPDKLALSFQQTNISFAEMTQAIDKLAAFFLKQGVMPEDKVAVLMDRTPSLIIAMFAIYKAGGIFVPINPKYPQERTQFVLEDSQAKFLLVNSRNKLSEEFKGKSIELPLNWLHLPAANELDTLPAVDLNRTAYIIYTSGTTGKPKGVMIRHASLTNLTAWYQTCFKMNKNDRASQMASQGFDTYICETVPVLGCGASVHIVDDNIKLTPTLFFEWLRAEEITIGDLPTAYAQMLFTLPWPDTLKLRMLKIGGESCTRYPDKKYSFDIWNVYGPTESTIEATFYKMYEANQEPSKKNKVRTPSIGKILANCTTYIVDKYLNAVAPGIAGELLIGGICLSSGYFNRDELTKERFIRNPFSTKPNEFLYRTGDLAAWLPDGNIKFIGRIDNQVKIRGYRIELGDIENVISKHPDVREVAVIAKESPNGQKSIIAYVVPNLDKERFLFQERCLLSIGNAHFVEAITEDISRYGIALTGITDTIPIGQKVKLHLKLPGFNEGNDISARLIWQANNRAGFVFDLTDKEQVIISKCIDHFLSSHNIMDLVLSASAKRSLRKALHKKLPEYMVPATFVTLTEFPLTFSGKVDLKALPPPDDYEQILRKQFIAPSTETEKKLTNIWRTILDKKEIGMEDNFFDIGGNSLKAAELSVNIMNEFNISVPAQILFDLSYVPILAEYIDTRGEQYRTQSYVQDEIDRDVILPENIIPAGKLAAHIDQPQNILLTGAGGFLGVFMLNELLQSTNAKIYCLVRKSEFESAATRLMSTIKNFGLDDSLSLANRRIIAVPSDLGLDRFGISHDHYESMANKIDTIFHCGAQVNIMASYNKLRTSNVQGTLEIIKFAMHAQDKPIHYVSTLSSAYLKDENGALAEEYPSQHYEELFGGYAISKWVSERLLTELKDRGAPINIYRSGYISGSSTTGNTSMNDALLLLMKGCMELGYAPEFHEKITILPVDFVSKAIISLSMLEPAESHIYHVDHPTGIMWTDLVAWLNQYGYSIKLIPMSEWQKKLRTIDKDNALYPFLPYYLALPENYRSPDVRTDKASKALKHFGISYPEINDKLLNTYFDYLVGQGFYKKPEKKKTSV